VSREYRGWNFESWHTTNHLTSESDAQYLSSGMAVVQDIGFFCSKVPQPQPFPADLEPPLRCKDHHSPACTAADAGVTTDAGATAPPSVAIDGLGSRLSALLSERPIWSYELLAERLGVGGSGDASGAGRGAVGDCVPASTSPIQGGPGPLQQGPARDPSSLHDALSQTTYRFRTGAVMMGPLHIATPQCPPTRAAMFEITLEVTPHCILSTLGVITTQ
jgi:hypothetical protein